MDADIPVSAAKPKSLRDQIEAADDRPRTEIDIPEWHIKAYIRPLSGAARWRLSNIAAEARKNENENSYITEAYVCEGLLDENDQQMYSIDDRALLAEKNPDVIERIFDAVLEASGMTNAQAAAAEKKSVRAPS